MHEVECELHTSARVGVMRPELQERDDRPQPKALLGLKVDDIGNQIVVGRAVVDDRRLVRYCRGSSLLLWRKCGRGVLRIEVSKCLNEVV